MPLPTVHLYIAYELAQRCEMHVDPGLYYVGAIAPDGIHSRKGATPDEKRRVHLASQTEVPLQDRFQTIQDFWISHEHSVDKPLLTRWITHLVADSIWSRHLVRGVWIEATRDLDQEQRNRLYYDEADKVDFILYRTVPWRPMVWETVANARMPAVADLLTPDEIAAWRDRLLRWFTEMKEEPPVELTIITMSRVKRFVDICVSLLSRGFETDLVNAIDTVPGLRGHGLLRGE